MIFEICVAVISFAFVILVVFLIITLKNAAASLKQTKHILNKLEHELVDISGESVKLIKVANELTTDIKKKTESLNFLFRPLFKINKEKSEEDEHDNYAKVSNIMNYISQGILLFKKLKGD
ncbi:MAG TPA: DUF948 domain-containing protein [Rhabdochlamydiaceae bacterium]|nr:DUF948 domain-containing protein [Rhabdochlamydiaceae bacterium]